MPTGTWTDPPTNWATGDIVTATHKNNEGHRLNYLKNGDGGSIKHGATIETTGQFKSTAPWGTPPLVVTSGTMVANLYAENADNLQGHQWKAPRVANAFNDLALTSTYQTLTGPISTITFTDSGRKIFIASVSVSIGSTAEISLAFAIWPNIVPAGHVFVCKGNSGDKQTVTLIEDFQTVSTVSIIAKQASGSGSSIVGINTYMIGFWLSP